MSTLTAPVPFVGPTRYFVDAPADIAEAIPEARPLDAILLYDDLPAGSRAMVALKRLADGLDVSLDVGRNVWRFDLLADPQWHAAAREAAIGAEVIAVATSQPDGLPPEITAWLDDCLEHKSNPDAILLVLLGTEDSWTISIHHRSGYCRAKHDGRAVAKTSGPRGTSDWTSFPTLPAGKR